jgi:uncharacterized protein YjbJ (UPF0337 family)
MDQDSIEGGWKQFKGKVKAQWRKLTGNQLDDIDGKRDELSEKLQEDYGNAREAVKEQVERLEERAKN